MALICVSIAASDVLGLVRAARAAKRGGADLVEARLDHLARCGPEDLVRLRKRVNFIPVVATLRPAREGGRYRGSERLRTELLERAVECGFDYVDVELGTGKARLASLLELCRRRGVKSIVSRHELRGTPGVARMVRMMVRCASAGDLGKVAVAARSAGDTLRIIRAMRKARSQVPNFIAMGMGPAGRLTRTLGPFLGSAVVYAGLDRRRTTAAGQPDLESLGQLLGILKKASGSTQLYGLLGHPLGHSLSPAMHNAAFGALGLDAAYIPFDVGPGGLKGAFAALREAGLVGANVTIPHKQRIIPLLDGLDGAARSIGAVNTIVGRNGKMVGHNTDARGFVDALKEAHIGLEGAVAVVLGAGGAARAAVHGLLEEGALVTVFNRTAGRARELPDALGAPKIIVAGLPDLRRAVGGADILVNCTPVGMKGFSRGSPVPGRWLRRGLAVMDMVYNPVRTPLLLMAERRGARTVSGMEMFLRQGRESLRLWTGETLSVKVLEDALGVLRNHKTGIKYPMMNDKGR